MYCRSLEAVAQPLEDYLLILPPQRVLDVTGGLVSMTDGVLRLIHSSVRDFLIRPEDQWVCEPDRAVLGFRIDIPRTHRSFAWLCLDYMRSEGIEGRFVEPDTSQSTKALRYSYPLLGYSTLYALFHLNRSGPLCPITIAKIEKILESTQSIIWIQHFTHLLFEDITLQSQMNEVVTCGDRMAEAGLETKFFVIFKETLNERNSQTRKLGKDVGPLTEHLEICLNQAADGLFGQKQSNEATDSILESSTAGPNLQNTFRKPRPSLNAASATVSRLTDLLKSQNSLSIAQQIELWLKLLTSLPKTSVMIDPLKVLFRLILSKASSIHVFTLETIGAFYSNLDKFHEALEVYTAASRKMDHLDVPLKFMLHYKIGYCYEQLCLDTEALRSYEKALSGQEIHLGRRHSDVLRTLIRMIRINHWMDQGIEVLRLSDRICTQQEFVSELDLRGNLLLHLTRSSAYRRLGNHERIAHVEKSLRTTLKLCGEVCSNGRIPPYLYKNMGYAYRRLGENDRALESFQLQIDAYNRSKKSKLSEKLHIQYQIASTYVGLGRYYEARQLFEMVHAKQQMLLGPNHRGVRWTKIQLDALGEIELGMEGDEAELDVEEDEDELIAE